MWQHVQLSEQICPLDTLVCYWDVKQLTYNNNKYFSHVVGQRKRKLQDLTNRLKELESKKQEVQSQLTKAKLGKEETVSVLLLLFGLLFSLACLF